jgi:hypothetical protein
MLCTPFFSIRLDNQELALLKKEALNKEFKYKE